MGEQLRIAGIVKESIVDGPGIRLVVFAQGCEHNCKGCHNPHTHSFDGGTLIDIDDIIEQVKKNPLLDGVTLSGGEPFEQAQALSELAEKVKKLNLNVITYTGYTMEYILENKEEHPGWEELLNLTDLLVDGKFELDKKNILLKFRGSENQRIIDVKESLKTGNITEAVL
ncbi:pyruvate formate-lyase 1-activating enzyme [Oxobacter pfennigii]|uniref:Anaerobic ribonucleoside-triphosphate reductase-activating protein n=1 Tax=Oxobacter pfennigii TaxID=36849 RepID=A0A0P8WAK1_9CLOT|nr:anaerobic ribonucleoside-triphosphate reductase activating protein [Oxobacter pfennigii]KPU45643.1 pyruvate formate-lyase 1-activating enzyme [Oxobacter pfennigii]